MSLLSSSYPTGALVLADGTFFYGLSCGADPKASGRLGEIVFNTAMSGYQEILTDPSYFGQIVVMTYPHIGNYGMNPEDMESRGSLVSGLVVHELSPTVSNWRANKSLRDYLLEKKIPALCGIDTRAVTRHIREKGAMNAYIVSPAPKTESEKAAILASLQKEPSFGERDLVNEVSCKESFDWQEPTNEWNRQWGERPISTDSPLVVVMDLGVKWNMLRHLSSRGCRVKVVPASTPSSEILKLKPKGLLLTNGPGDPAKVKHVPNTVRELLGQLPIFGICMGHQILAHAIGARTFKMKFGHHGANQPVLDLASGKVLITSQNHGYAIDPKTLPAYAKVSQINLNDQSVEGISLPELKAMSVQYHPEACPGPRDAAPYFDEFMRAMGYA